MSSLSTCVTLRAVHRATTAETRGKAVNFCASPTSIVTQWGSIFGAPVEALPVTPHTVFTRLRALNLPVDVFAG